MPERKPPNRTHYLALTQAQAAELEDLGRKKRLLAKLLASVLAREERLLAEVRRMEVVYPREKAGGGGE